MSAVLGHVLEDFERARINIGVVVQDRYRGRELNLGYVEEKSVAIRDISKESFQVTILFSSVAHGFRNSLLKTTVYGVDYNSCAFDRSEKIIYNLQTEVK